MKDVTHFTLADLIKDQTFLQYLDGSDQQAIVFWEQFITDNPDKLPLVEEAKFIVQSGFRFRRIEAPIKLKEYEWNRLSMAIDEIETQRSRLFSHSFLRIAASVTSIILTASVVLYMALRSSQRHELTSFAEIKNITLPDGSEVTLNANSEITFDEQWKTNEKREVWINGEAFFKVKKAHSLSNRFIVHSNEAQVQVLGTEFNVNNRQGETTVVLHTGSLIVKKDDPEDTLRILMKPGDFVKYSPVKRKASRKRVNTVLYISWKDGKFIFNNTSLAEIVELIQQQYGLQVIIKSESLKTRTLSGEARIRSADVFLEALSRSFNIKVVRDGNTVTLEDKI